MNNRDFFGRSSVFTAIRHTDWEVVNDLITACNPNLSVADIYGWNPLMYAVAFGKECTVRGLLNTEEYNDQLDAQDIEGNTCVIIATLFGRVSILELLIRAGAKICIQNNSGKTALHYIAMGDLRPIFVYMGYRRQLVLKCGKRYVPKLRHPNRDGDKNLVSSDLIGSTTTSTVSSDSSCSSSTRSGWTRKRTSLRKERLGIVQTYPSAIKICKLLIASGADINSTDIDGLGPVHYCLIGGNVFENNEFSRFVDQMIHDGDAESPKKLLQCVDESRSSIELDQQESNDCMDQADDAEFGNGDEDENLQREEYVEIGKEVEEKDPMELEKKKQFFVELFSLLMEHGAKLDINPERSRKLISSNFPKLNMPDKTNARPASQRASVVTPELIRRNEEANKLIRRKREWSLAAFFQ